MITTVDLTPESNDQYLSTTRSDSQSGSLRTSAGVLGSPRPVSGWWRFETTGSVASRSRWANRPSPPVDSTSNAKNSSHRTRSTSRRVLFPSGGRGGVARFSSIELNHHFIIIIIIFFFFFFFFLYLFKILKKISTFNGREIRCWGAMELKWSDWTHRAVNLMSDTSE